MVSKSMNVSIRFLLGLCFLFIFCLPVFALNETITETTAPNTMEVTAQTTVEPTTQPTTTATANATAQTTIGATLDRTTLEPTITTTATANATAQTTIGATSDRTTMEATTVSTRSTVTPTSAIKPPEPYTIQTSVGLIKGESRNANEHKRMSVFLGIPYAEAPVGPFRWKDPLTKKPWTGVLDATAYKLDCPQDRFIDTSEDCLYLNIWTPKTADSSNTSTYPVLVWFHGGRFETGGSKATLYNGENIVGHQEAIVVTFNYRIGALGFMFLEGNEFTGNYGIKDQRMLLSWLKLHIGNFGGDPTKITLMGSDAGAASIGFLMLDATLKDNFKQAIMLGGSPLMPWTLTNNTGFVSSLSKIFLAYLGCGHVNQTQSRECVSKVNATDIIRLQKNYNRFFQGLEFSPIIDNDVIVGDPWEKVPKGEFLNRNLIIGATDNEGGQLGTRSLNAKNITFPAFNSSLLLREIEDSMMWYPRSGDQLSTVGKRFLKLHFTQYSNPNDGIRNAEIFQNAIGDWYLGCPSINMARANEMIDPQVYLYRFSEPDQHTQWKGASHGEDVTYAFGIPTGDGVFYTQFQKKLSEKIMDYFVTFARTGKVPTSWFPLDNKDGKQFNYYEFNANETLVGPKKFGYRMNECNWWSQTLSFVNNLTEKIEDRSTTSSFTPSTSVGSTSSSGPGVTTSGNPGVTTSGNPGVTTSGNPGVTTSSSGPGVTTSGSPGVTTSSSGPGVTTSSSSPGVTTSGSFSTFPPIGPGELARQCAGRFNQVSVIITSSLGGFQVFTLIILVVLIFKLKSLSQVGVV